MAPDSSNATKSHGGRLPFNRPPRLRRALSATSFRIPPPPPQMQPPQTSAVTSIGIPMITAVIMGSVYFASSLQNPQSRGFSFMQVAAIGMVLGSVVPMILMFIHERRSFKQKAEAQAAKYRAKLAQAENGLLALRGEEIDLRGDQHPAGDELIGRARSHSARLWERRPEDDDFLKLRLGLGWMPSLVHIEGEVGQEGYDLAEGAYQLAQKFQRVPGVPITCDLPAIGSLGLAGPLEPAADLARSLVAQAAAHHSPEEVRLVAFFGPDDVAEWTWVKWLPHSRSLSSNDPGDRMLSWSPAGTKRLADWLMAEMSNRERAAAEGDDPSVKLPHLLVLVRDYELVRGQMAFDLLFGRGKALGVSLICMASDPLALPGECAAVVNMFLSEFPDGSKKQSLSSALFTLAGPEPNPLSLAPDSLGAPAGEEMARALAPLIVVRNAVRGQEDVPNRASFLEMMAVPHIDDLNVTELWSHTDVRSLLRTPLGLGAGEVLQYLDLKEPDKGGHGPHGLVAGTTGSGKSELLRSLVAGLALHHSPESLTFLLVDYKGGGAFGALADLPHVVGLVTDLDPGLADRALVALRAELKKRERLVSRLKDCGAANLEEYQSLRGGRDPIPFLFIVVDEFAQLKSEMPDFIEGLIEVARVGRSLGVRLLLATQTPSGTVDGEIQKNSNYGICLRVRDAGDSREVIGQPDAFMLPGRIPGRAYLKVAGEPIKLFQSAYISGKYEPRTADKVATIDDFLPLLRQRRNVDAEIAAEVSFQTAKETELEAVVARLVAAAGEIGLRKPERIWPDPLPTALPLCHERLLPQAEHGGPYVWPAQPLFGSMAAIIGLLDEPAAQRQDPFKIDLVQAGSLLVFGAPGSGKTTLVRTLAMSLSLTHTPAALHLYCLDFGSRALKTLENLPHCGGVLLPVDADRIKRLVRMLGAEMLHRKAALSEANTTSVESYNASRAGEALPHILVLIDNYAALRETFEEEEQTSSQEHTMGDLAVLVRDGPALGMYFAITTSVFNAVSGTVANVIGTRIALRQADDLDYGLIGRFPRMPGRIPPGRGFIAGSPPLEFQTAFPASEETTGLRDIVDRLSASWTGSRPQVIERLPERAWLAPLLESVAAAPDNGARASVPLVLGLDDHNLQPAVLDLQRETQLLITGPAGSGKTSLLLAALLSLVQPGVTITSQVYLTAVRPSPIRELASLPSFKQPAFDMEGLSKQVEELERIVEERRATTRAFPASGAAGAGDPLIVVAIDDYDALLQEEDFSLLDSRLRNLARRGVPVGLRLLVAGLNSELRNTSDRLTRYLTDGRTGVLLQPDMELDGILLYARLRRSGQADMPTGRGYLVTRQRLRLVQSACIEHENEGLSSAIQRWLKERAIVGSASRS